MSTELQDHQKRVLKKLEKSKGVLVYHGLGSGKTLTGLAAAKQNEGASVIGPASLKRNFKEENKKHKINAKVDYSTYSKPTPKKKNLVIYDEAHRIGRADTKRSKYPQKFKSDKVLLLTGTPIRNEPSELIPLLKAIDVKVPGNKKDFYAKYVKTKEVKPGIIGRFKGVKPGIVQEGKNLKDLQKKLKGKVDYHRAGKKNYPSVREKDVYVPMSKEQLKTYKTVLKKYPEMSYKVRKNLPPGRSDSGKMNAFLNASRQVSNTASSYNMSAKEQMSPKVKAMLSDIQRSAAKDKNYKGITYSNYLDSGVNRIEKGLKKTKIPYAKFTGNTTDEDRKRIVKEYNKGKIKQLLLSGAGSEGLDLKGTKLVQNMEPH